MNDKETIDNLLTAQQHMALARKQITDEIDLATLNYMMTLIPGIIRRAASSLRVQ